MMCPKNQYSQYVISLSAQKIEYSFKAMKTIIRNAYICIYKYGWEKDNVCIILISED